MKILLALVIAATLAAPAVAAPALAPPLAGLGFLVGDWKADASKVPETGGTAVGASQISIEADGQMLLRNDRTETFDKAGKPSGVFHQIMLIYPEGGTLHGDYGDGEGHVIHYTSAAVTPGKSVEFTAPADAAAPGFRLTYTATAKDALTIQFGMLPPGGAPFHEIASGVVRRVR